MTDYGEISDRTYSEIRGEQETAFREAIEDKDKDALVELFSLMSEERFVELVLEVIEEIEEG